MVSVGMGMIPIVGILFSASATVVGAAIFASDLEKSSSGKSTLASSKVGRGGEL